ncbi:MAG: hypothetical protein PF487_03615 [Bacteroidales bacterium]|jgi:hypothetical protein|nr:hypothetical protein [Bacteroidales bacterium]
MNLKYKYKYKVFGFTIASEFSIASLMPSDDNPDVFLRYGIIDDDLKNPIYTGVRFQIAKNDFLLKVDNVAKFLISKGKTIIVDKVKTAGDEEINLFLLGSAMGALIHQRGMLPIHGSTIKIKDKSVIFSGTSGVGKSSISAYFVKKGYKIVADDISVVSVNDNRNIVSPGYPRIKLWEDVSKKLNIETNDSLRIRPQINKYGLNVSESFYNSDIEVNKMIIISTKNTPGFEIEKLKGIEKFNALKNNTYRFNFAKELQKKQSLFSFYSKFLPNIEIYRLYRPRQPLMLDELYRFIVEKCDL